MFDFFRRLFPRTPDAPIASPLAQTIVYERGYGPGDGDSRVVAPVKPPRPEVVDLASVREYGNLL